jgi:TPR repeat protein
MEQYKLGMDMYHKANYRKAVELLTLACPTGITNPDRYYDGYAALAWMLENGKGTDDDHPSRLAQPLYKILAQHGDKNAMESYVRMTLKDEEPEVEPCQLSLDYIKKLNQKKLNQKVPELEKKLATAQAEDEKREKFWEEHAGQNIFELLEDLNQG